MQVRRETKPGLSRAPDSATASFCSLKGDARPGWETRFSCGERQRPHSSNAPPGMRGRVVETTSIMFDVGVSATVCFVGAAIATRDRVRITIGNHNAYM